MQILSWSNIVICFSRFFFSSRRRHTRWTGDWSSDVCSSDLVVLDAHAGLASLAQETGDAHREWQRLCRTRLDHESNTAAREAEREQLTWQVEELSRLALAPGEWETIQSEHGRLAHAASL